MAAVNQDASSAAVKSRPASGMECARWRSATGFLRHESNRLALSIHGMTAKESLLPGVSVAGATGSKAGAVGSTSGTEEATGGFASVPAGIKNGKFGTDEMVLRLRASRTTGAACVAARWLLKGAKKYPATGRGIGNNNPTASDVKAIAHDLLPTNAQSDRGAVHIVALSDALRQAMGMRRNSAAPVPARGRYPARRMPRNCFLPSFSTCETTPGARIVYPPRGETQTNDSLFCSGSRATTAQEQTLARAAGWIKESSLHSTDTHPDPYRRGAPSVKISELYSVQSNNEKSPTAQWVSASIKKDEEDGSIRSAGDALSLAQRAGF